jgi:hypothetical protein
MHRTLKDSEGFVATPGAIVTHPWWDDGVPKYSHFSGWAQGDGHLIDLYPEHTYLNFPDLSETTLLLATGLATQAAVAGFLKSAVSTRISRFWSVFASPSAMRITCVTIMACITADVAYDLTKCLVSSSALSTADPSNAPRALPWHERALATLHGVGIRTTSEMGRLYGHAARGKLTSNIFRRFNWFGYMWPEAPSVERKESLKRNVVRVAVSTLALLLFSQNFRGK